MPALLSSPTALGRPALAAAALAAATLAFAAPAAVADEPTPPAPCWPAFGPGQNPFQSDFMRLRLGEQVPHAIGADQLGEIAIGPAAGTWTVRVAPGPLDLAAARAAIEQRLRSVLPTADADLAMAALQVEATPYPFAELRTLAGSIAQQLHGAGFTSYGVGPSCRVIVTLFQPNGPAELAQVRQLVAAHGDKVWVELQATPGPSPASAGVGGPAVADAPKQPAPAPQPPVQDGRHVTPGLALAAVLRAPSAKRCVRGKAVTLRPRDGARLTVTVRGRTRRLGAGKAARVALGRGATAVTIKATARDGRTVTQRLTYRRCATQR